LARPLITNDVVPVVKGEYYSYRFEFSSEKPVFALMHCKANKGRLIEELPVLKDEASMFFFFSPKGVTVCPIKDAAALGVVDGLKTTSETVISETTISVDEFLRIRAKRDGWLLHNVCNEQMGQPKKFLNLHNGKVFAVSMSNGKRGLFMVKESCASSIILEACHVLM
jgi:hypothetical protein